jgi:NAD(P)-dependent dehydrogenase (short-subunit alcohol dehydrogenase family)
VEDLRFDGRVVLITGAGRGLGRAHALLLARQGAKIIVNDTGAAMNGSGASAAPAEGVVAEITSRGGTAFADASDVSTEQGAEEMVQRSLEHFGRLDVVIHNAGIVNFTPFSQMSYAQYRQLVAVHQDGGFLVAKAAWPQMMKQDYGRLVFTTSLASMAGLAHYASAKAALGGFVRCLAEEGQAHGIRVNAASVMAYTRMMAAFFDPTSGHLDVGLHGQHEVETWWQGYLRAEQVSPVVGWLAHESCNINGQTLFTAGGQVSLQFTGLTQGYARTDITGSDVLAHEKEILDVAAGFHVYAGGLDGWLFERIVKGGAPPLPEPR